MAGKYIEFINPGYSTLFTRDLKYKLASARDGGADEAESGIDVFNPDSAAPLFEGEFLELAADNKVTRGGTSTCAHGDNVGTKPAWIHFHERGRYDAQITKKAHLVSGPAGMEFQTGLCYCAAGEEGEPVFVVDVVHPSDANKHLRGLATLSQVQGTMAAGNNFYAVGFCQRVITSQVSNASAGSYGKMVVQYMPHTYQA